MKKCVTEAMNNLPEYVIYAQGEITRNYKCADRLTALLDKLDTSNKWLTSRTCDTVYRLFGLQCK